MKKLSDWEQLQQRFAEDFPDLASMKKCSDCIHSIWAKVVTETDEQSFTPYCSKLNFVLRTLVEAENCDSYTIRSKE